MLGSRGVDERPAVRSQAVSAVCIPEQALAEPRLAVVAVDVQPACEVDTHLALLRRTCPPRAGWHDDSAAGALGATVAVLLEHGHEQAATRIVSSK